MTTNGIRFMWNGIKVNGKLFPAWYSWHSGPRRLTVAAKKHDGFPAEVRAEFAVTNNSDSMTDFFDKDRIRIRPEHPRFAEALAALKLEEAYEAKNRAKRTERAKAKKIELLESDLKSVQSRMCMYSTVSPTNTLLRQEAAILAELTKARAS